MKKTILFLLCTLCFLVAVASIACTGGGTHEHYFTQEVATVRYLASDATCTQSATYYYSCKCGIKDTNTFEYGTPLGHDFSDWQVVTQPTETEEGLKTRKCMRKGCGYTESENIEVIGHTHSFTEQIITDEFLASSATCVNKATYYYSCACGEKSENTFEYGESLGHDYINGLCTRCGEKFFNGHLEYRWDDRGMEGYSCVGFGTVTDTDIVIPSEYAGFPVTSIGPSAFKYCSSLTSVTIPNSVTSIGSDAFAGCGLTSITIPNSVTSIGSDAFEGCSNLTSITLPDNLRKINDSTFRYCIGLTSITLPDSLLEIGDAAFAYCIGLTSITLPDSLLEIGDAAFAYCSGLTSVTIPDSVTSIGGYAFFNCGSLTSIVIPDSVTSIGSGAFAYCGGLEKIVVDSGNTRYHSAGNCLIETETKTLIAGCKKSLIPTDGSVTSIGAGAFGGCSSLTSITIPDSVTSIGSGVFNYCSGLEKIVVSSGNKVYHDAGNCLIETETKTLIAGCKKSIIPADGSVTSIGEYAFYGCGGLTSIIIPDGITSIGDYAFEDCSSLQYNIYNNAKYLGNANNPYVALISSNDREISSCEINQNTKVIAKMAFEHCSKLTSITIPDSVVYINERAFVYCTGLTSVVIGNSVISIGDFAFEYCWDITSIIISESVTSIGGSAFWTCDNLQYNIYDNAKYLGNQNNPYVALISSNDREIISCEINQKTKVIGDYAFVNCSNLTSITIPDNVISIGNYAFSNCSSLTSITIPDSVTSIGSSAFSKCSSLTSITIPDSVTSIGDYTFNDCGSLTSIEISNSVTSIGDYAFFKCSSLTSIMIPDSVTSIGSSAFSNCYNLTSITIGNSVTLIGDYAFYKCGSLTNVTFKNTNGWKVTNDRNTQTLQSSSLSDVYTAAQYLTLDYLYYTWKRG